MDMTTTKQDVFDAMAYMTPELVVLYHDLEEHSKKHMADVKSVGFTDSYYDDMAAIAEKHGVAYVNPKYKRGLKSVETSATVH